MTIERKSDSFCDWAKPLPKDEPFEEAMSDELIDILGRYQLEYQAKECYKHKP